MTKQTLLRATITLAMASLFSRLLGFINDVVMARLLGPEGAGLTSMASPIIFLTITLASAGLPVAISKFIAEAEVNHQKQQVIKVLVISLFITGFLSLFFTALLFLGVKTIATYYLTDPRAYLYLLAIIPVVPIVAISSVLKGFFQGKRNMTPIALSHILEESIEILFVIILIQILLPYGLKYAVAGSAIGTVIGEAASLVFLSFNFKRLLEYKQIKKGFHQSNSYLKDKLRSGKYTLHDLQHTAIPTLGNQFMEAIYATLQPVLITNSLVSIGLKKVAATKQYGLLTGYALPLIVFASFITDSLAATLVPAVSEAKRQKNFQLIQTRINEALYIAMMVGVPCTVILYLWADPITTILYKSSTVTPLLKILTPVYLFIYVQMPFRSILVGLGKARVAFWNDLIGYFARIIGILLFGLVFQQGILGVAIAFNFSVCMTTLLHISSVTKDVGITFQVKPFIQIVISTIIMIFFGKYFDIVGKEFMNNALIHLITTISFSLFIYVLCLIVAHLRGIFMVPSLVKRK